MVTIMNSSAQAPNARILETISEPGRIGCQVLPQCYESIPSLDCIRKRFGSDLCCSALEALVTAMDARVAVIFGKGDRVLGDTEIVETPAVAPDVSAFSAARRTAIHASLPATRSFSGMRGGRPRSFTPSSPAHSESAPRRGLSRRLERPGSSRLSHMFEAGSQTRGTRLLPATAVTVSREVGWLRHMSRRSEAQPRQD